MNIRSKVAPDATLNDAAPQAGTRGRPILQMMNSCAWAFKLPYDILLTL